MKKDIFRDRNGKLSSKRIIAYIYCATSIILIPFYMFGIIDIQLIGIFALASTGQGFACSLEKKI